MRCRIDPASQPKSGFRVGGACTVGGATAATLVAGGSDSGGAVADCAGGVLGVGGAAVSSRTGVGGCGSLSDGWGWRVLSTSCLGGSGTPVDCGAATAADSDRKGST